MKIYSAFLLSLVLLIGSSVAFADRKSEAQAERELVVQRAVIEYLSAQTWNNAESTRLKREIERLGTGNPYKRANENALLFGRTVDSLPEDVKNSPLFRQKLNMLVNSLNPNSDPLTQHDKRWNNGLMAFCLTLAIAAAEYPHQSMSVVINGLRVAIAIVSGSMFASAALMKVMDVVMTWQEPKIRVAKNEYNRLLSDYCSDVLSNY